MSATVPVSASSLNPDAPGVTPLVLKGLSLAIFSERYAWVGEDWSAACLRVATANSKAETNGKVAYYRDRFNGQLLGGKFMPGGRFWYGSGRKVQQTMNCVSGGTLVHTDQGVVPARSLAGKTLPVLSEGGVYRLSTWSSYGDQELYTVIFENGDEIEATAGHEWVVAARRGTERVTTEDLAGRRVPMVGRKSFVYDESSFAEGIRHGLVYGDGQQSSPNRTELYQFGDSKQLVYDHFDSHRTVPHRVGGGAAVASKLPGHYKSLPEGNEGESYLRGFVAGLMAADGHVDKRGHVQVHQADRDALVSVRKFAAVVGLPSSSIRMVREFNPWSGERSPLYSLTFLKEYFYNDARLLLKANHTANMAGSPKPRRCGYTAKVRAVLPTGRVEEVFCCDEPETHTWVAGAGYLTGNCYVLGVEDSIEGWGKLMSDTATISARGGGVGTNFSPVRPRGYPISGMGGTTTGAVSLMKIVNAIGEEIKDGGGRRAALMFCLNVNHPDVEEFLDAKMKIGEISNANISVMIPDDMPTEDFVRMVRGDEMMPLVFNGLPDKLGRELSAKKLWEWLVGNAWEQGEPGLLNWFLVQKMNNIQYVRDLVATNPCGEQNLSAFSNCCLGHLVLPRFVKTGVMEWAELDESIRLAVRFLDNAIDVAAYPLPENEKVSAEERRIGLGVMGLHSMLLDLGMKYDSPEAFEFVDKLMSTIKNTAYDASINLAIEKGPFPLYSPKMLDGGFVRTLKPGIKHKIREHGVRNCCILTVAPCGTTSMVQGVTGGIEPVFSPVYIRRRRVVDANQRETLTETLVVSEEYLDHPDLVQGAYDVHPRAHMEMQKIVQEHVDSAVSKTINLPKSFPKEELSELWLEYLPHLKGTTFYREGSREVGDSYEPMKHVSAENVKATIEAWGSSGKEIEYEIAEVDDCASGSCEI